MIKVTILYQLSQLQQRYYKVAVSVTLLSCNLYLSFVLYGWYEFTQYPSGLVFNCFFFLVYVNGCSNSGNVFLHKWHLCI